MKSCIRVALVALLGGAACSSSSGTSASSDAGPNPDAGDASRMVTDRGVVFSYDTGAPLIGVTVTENGTSTTTDSTGAWSIPLPAGVPGRVTLRANGYVTGYFFEEIFDGDNDRGKIPILSSSTFQLSQAALAGYDATLASISIDTRTLPSCASVDGAVVTVVSPAGTSLTYFRGGLPNRSAMSVNAGERPALSVYNVPLHTDLELAVRHPTCKMAPFPVKVGAATYTGKVDTAADATSALALYLE